MKINSIQRNNMINAYSKQRQDYKPETVHKQNKDKVTISEDAKYLSKITTENVDLEKINEIKNRIKQGTYNVNSKGVAEKILQNIKGNR